MSRPPSAWSPAVWEWRCCRALRSPTSSMQARSPGCASRAPIPRRDTSVSSAARRGRALGRAGRLPEARCTSSRACPGRDVTGYDGRRQPHQEGRTQWVTRVRAAAAAPRSQRRAPRRRAPRPPSRSRPQTAWRRRPQSPPPSSTAPLTIVSPPNTNGSPIWYASARLFHSLKRGWSSCAWWPWSSAKMATTRYWTAPRPRAC